MPLFLNFSLFPETTLVTATVLRCVSLNHHLVGRRVKSEICGWYINVLESSDARPRCLCSKPFVRQFLNGPTVAPRKLFSLLTECKPSTVFPISKKDDTHHEQHIRLSDYWQPAMNHGGVAEADSDPQTFTLNSLATNSS